MTRSRSATGERLPLNTLAIAFGCAGLATVWEAAARAAALPAAVPATFWGIAVLVWVALLVAHAWRGARSPESLVHQLRQPAQGPVAALVPVVALLFSARLAPFDLDIARVTVGTAIIASVAFAGWMVGFWLRGGLDIDAVHGGYLLPTVAAGYIASSAASAVGWSGVATASFWVATAFWVVVFTALLGRLALRPRLPDVLTPTLAILAAPPAVGAAAWTAMTGETDDTVQQAFAGALVLMVLVQIGLLRRYLGLGFTLGFWSFTFPAAAVAVSVIHWVPLAPVALALAGAVTVLVGAVAGRSVVAAVTGARARAADLTGSPAPR